MIFSKPALSFEDQARLLLGRGMEGELDEIRDRLAVVSYYRLSGYRVQTEVAKAFGVSERVLQSWLWSLNEVRNVCAHHGRLWNREIGNKPMIPRRKHHPAWHDPVAIGNERVFGVLTICADALGRFAPGTSWPRRVRDLVEGQTVAPMRNMGFPDRWLESPLWKGALGK